MVYKKAFSGVMYFASFGVTLVVLTMITTSVILAVTSSEVLSLGMAGALSIGHFRTAVKEPLDLAFLFRTIAVGIVLKSKTVRPGSIELELRLKSGDIGFVNDISALPGVESAGQPADCERIRTVCRDRAAGAGQKNFLTH